MMFKKFAAALLSLVLIVSVGFVSLEPTVSKAVTDNVVVTLSVTTGITISTAGATSMSQALGVAAFSAVGTTTWTVVTNDSAGYTLAVNSTSTPAMGTTGAALTIKDYQTGSPNTWNATTSDAYFGYSAFGTDASTGTWGTGSQCSGATPHATSTTLKYKGFTGSPFTVANRSSTTTPAGIATTICYAVEQRNYFIPSGTYQATIVGTATSL